jgi:hypothetical protein
MRDGDKKWSWLFDFVTMVAVLVGLTFGAIELRQLRTAQEAQAILELYRTVQTPEYVRGTQLILALPEGLTPADLREIKHSEDGQIMQQVQLTFEGLGVMVYRRDVPIEWVDEMFRLMILTTWRKFEPLTLEERETTGYGGLMEWHQWLAERIEERSGGEDPRPAYDAYRDWTEDGS